MFKTATIFTKTHPYLNYGQTGTFFYDENEHHVFVPHDTSRVTNAINCYQPQDWYYPINVDDVFFDDSSYNEGVCKEQVLLSDIEGAYKRLDTKETWDELKQVRKLILNGTFIPLQLEY